MRKFLFKHREAVIILAAFSFIGLFVLNSLLWVIELYPFISTAVILSLAAIGVSIYNYKSFK